MKKFFTVFMVVSCAILFGQEYQPLLGADNYWDIQNINSIGDGNYSGHDFQCIITEETLIFNEREYITLEYRFRPTNDIIGPGEWTEWTSGAVYLREDIDEKKVYVYYPEWGQEYLLYDFNLGVGDTIDLQGFWNYQYFEDHEQPVITSITYENVFGIENVKTYHLDCIWNHNFVIYEGIGASSGLLTLSLELDYIWRLIDFKNDYMGVKESATSKTKVYPNPFTNTIRIENAEKIVELQLFDLNGKLISTTQNLDDLNVKLNSLNNGIYILKIQTQNNQVETVKLIKNK